MKNIIESEYEGKVIRFNDSGWFDATEAASRYGKRPVDWLKLDGTKSYISSLKKVMSISEDSSLIQSRRNKGTWLHPRLAVAFARWLDNEFAIWCDVEIDKIMRGETDSQSWQQLRYEASNNFSVMNEILRLSRLEEGKDNKFFHYANEAKLINFIVSGEFKPLDRNSLSKEQLKHIAALENKNAVMIGRNIKREDRKSALLQFAREVVSQEKLH